VSINNIHQWLIFRLLLVWFFLSLLIGTVVYFLGNIHLDNYIISMAKNETTAYTEALASYLKSPSKQSLSELNRRIHLEIERDNLIVVELYDDDARRITEAVKPSGREIEDKLPSHDSEFASQNDIVKKKILLGDDTYLRVFVPIINSAGRKIGYLEGIYHVPTEIITQTRQQTLLSLILVILVILVTSLAVYPLIIRLNRKLIDYSRILAMNNIQMLKMLGSAIAKRDSDTNIHNYRVTLYSVRIGERLALPLSSMQGLIKGAFLHDLGKIAISDSILHKAGKLTDEEFEIMKSHVRHGEDIIRSYDWLKDALEVVCYHHEKFDGSGYPSGLLHENIPINARIFMVADVFDALTSKRPYKESFGIEITVDILKESQGRHFDPNVTKLFLENVDALYSEICHNEEVLLHEKLEECIMKYFQ
jgi:HD-GYP domain-containing protein (c-di-GMP phosphodiesterase class II)